MRFRQTDAFFLEDLMMNTSPQGNIFLSVHKQTSSVIHAKW